jgi:hypothetical protein
MILYLPICRLFSVIKGKLRIPALFGFFDKDYGERNYVSLLKLFVNNEKRLKSVSLGRQISPNFSVSKRVTYETSISIALSDLGAIFFLECDTF